MYIWYITNACTAESLLCVVEIITTIEKNLTYIGFAVKSDDFSMMNYNRIFFL